MKTGIGTYKQPNTFIRVGLTDIINLEMVLRRHVLREYRDRNLHPLIKPLQRLDIRDGIKALRSIKATKLEYSHVD